MSLLLKILYKRALNLSHVSQSSNPSSPMPLITKATPRILPNSPIRPSSATLMLDTLSVLTVTDNPPQTTYNIRASPSDPGEPSSNTFEELVQDLSIALGPTSGLDSDDVDPLNIQHLMERYTSNQDDWLRFALGDSTRSYTRNLIDEGNGKSNLLILVWNPGRGSAIHDHANAHCVMKVLKGTLQETLYTWPDQERIEHGQVSPPQVKKVTTYGENQVTYMSDKLGLHKIHNPDPNDVAISLHFYTPPNAANYGVSIFDEKSGKACHIKQSNFYSIRGKRA